MVAESWTPTCGVPVIVGGAVAASTPGAVAAVATEMAVPVCVPVFVAVTLTRSCLPSCSARGVNVRFVAPVMAPPPAYHW